MSDLKTKLIAGYQSFKAGHYLAQKKLYETLGKGQSPKVMLIACADSRVDPTDIFNAYPGEMFVVRNVANIVPPLDKEAGYHGVSSAVEYAVRVIGVEMIVVMGHESCGGVKGCLDGLGDNHGGNAIGGWVSLLNDVRDRVVAQNHPEDRVAHEMELESIRQSLENLQTYDFVTEAVSAGKLALQGAYFSIAQARLLMSDDAGVFSEIAATAPQTQILDD